MIEQLWNHLTDSDLYKFTQGYAIAKRYPRAFVRYSFINRDKTPFPAGFAEELRHQVELMSHIRLTNDEHSFLTTRCGEFLDPPYLDFLRGYQFDPREVKIEQEGGDLKIGIEGPWYRTVYYEVPLMAIISELYFKMVSHLNLVMRRDHIDSLAEVEARAMTKAANLTKAGCQFADFGTRRRYSLDVQSTVVKTFVQKFGSVPCFKFIGTSNVYLAMLYNTKPTGTQAHEFFSFHAAKYGFRMANSMALGRWVDVFGGNLGIALSDTFTTQDFLRSFDVFYANLFNGVRQDSGCPFEFGEKIITHYNKLGIDPLTKTIVFSDNLNVKKAIEIQQRFEGRIKVSFGIGTHFSNDTGVKPLNMVIKMTEAKIDGSWVPTIKLSDDPGKWTGDPKTIALAKQTLGV